MKPTCGICAGLHRRSRGFESQPWDVLLFESERFAAVPSRGSIVPGWVLIVTKEHRICMGEVPTESQQELAKFTSAVRKAVRQAFGPTVVFEHGPSVPNQSVGCGVDHAHLHIVPTSCDLVAGLSDVHPEPVTWCRVTALEDVTACYRRGKSYLFVEQEEGLCWVGTAHELPSQAFRKVIARSVGRSEQFDWKLYPEIENGWVTVEALGNGCPVGAAASR